MSITEKINPWSARLLFILCLALSFLIPFSAAVLVEKALVKHWERYGFSHEQIYSWWDNSILSMDTAKAWRAEGFSAPEAKPWIMMNISSGEAREWKDAGVDLPVAMEWRKHGFEAEQATSWRTRGLSPAGAAQAKQQEGTP